MNFFTIMADNRRIYDFWPLPTRARTTDDPASSGREREGQGRSVAEPTAAAERSASQGARNTNTDAQRSESRRARKRQGQQDQMGEGGREGRGAATRARREDERGDARQAAERSKRTTRSRPRVPIRYYGGQRIAMRRPLKYGAGRMKQNYKHVDRSGRAHVAWETTTGVLLTSARAAREQGLPQTHVALGGGNPPERVGREQSGDGRRQAGRVWAGGRYVGRHHLSDDQRKRLRCDAAALPDGRQDKEAWTWARGGAGKRRKVHVGREPPEDGRQWCRWGRTHVYMEGKYYAGPLQALSTPRVRSWNRFVAAANTPLSRHGAGRVKKLSVDAGRKMWELRRRVASGDIVRPKDIGEWREQLEMHDYDTPSVVYVEVPLRRGEMPYVGETSESAWTRHEKRLHHVFAREAASTGGGGRAKYARADDELDEYERQLRRCGAEAARHERYVLVLEQVERREGEGEVDWTARRKRVEKFWVSTLHTAFNKKGWNVEHAPATLQRLPGGRPTRRTVKGQERARMEQRGRNRRLKRRRRSDTHAEGTNCESGEMECDAAAGGRRGRRFHRGPRPRRAEKSRRRRSGGGEAARQRQRQPAGGGGQRRSGGTGGGRRHEANDESVRVRRATAELDKGQKCLKRYLDSIGLSMLERILGWL